LNINVILQISCHLFSFNIFYRKFVTVWNVDACLCYLMNIEEGEDWIDLAQDRDK